MATEFGEPAGKAMDTSSFMTAQQAAQMLQQALTSTGAWICIRYHDKPRLTATESIEQTGKKPELFRLIICEGKAWKCTTM